MRGGGVGEIKGGVFDLRVQFTGIWGQSGLDCCETWKTVKCKIVFLQLPLPWIFCVETENQHYCDGH